MDVAHDALAGGDGARELVLDGMAGFIVRNGGIDFRAVTLVAVLGIRAGVNRRTVVGVDDVAGRAAAVAIVAGMIVGAGHREDGIEQARLLEAKKNRIGPQLGSETPVAQLHVGTPGIFFGVGNADLGALSPSPLEHAQNIAGLRNFPARQRIQVREHAFGARQILRRRRISVDALRDAIR